MFIGVSFVNTRFLEMQLMGVEPTRVLPHQNLNLARLPFRHNCIRDYPIITDNHKNIKPFFKKI